MVAAVSTDATLGRFLVAANLPSEELDATQGQFKVGFRQESPITATLGRLLVACKGRSANPRLKAWRYDLDGHENYVLRLGDDKTLQFDLSTGQWSWYNSRDKNYWRLFTGMNWNTPGGNAMEKGSNIVAGDDTFGIVWILNPLEGWDDSTDPDDTTKMRFLRSATAQMITRGRHYLQCFQVYLTGSSGEPVEDNDEVTLSYSDDQGHTFKDAGGIQVEDGNYNQNYAWRSLGKIGAPGRLFRIEDDGAFARIDELDIGNGDASDSELN